LPSNTGAGYVIRRILRRAVRYYYSYLDFEQPLIFKLVPFLAKQFEKVFPELDKQKDFVSKVVREEEEAFLRTLDKGLTKLNSYIDRMGVEEGRIPGKTAFELFDTYGFPLDLTELIAREREITVDEQGFLTEMKIQKERSRAATTVDTEDWVVLIENGLTKFLGYESLETKAMVVKYRLVKSKDKQFYHIVLDNTPFYAESGGQTGDRGVFDFPKETIRVLDTKKENDLIIHFTETLPVQVNEFLIARVDSEERKATAIHHSATHLLHAALRKVLGIHVQQKGSLVNEDHLRFDFSHFAKVSEDELNKIESLVNEKIRENIPVVIRQLPTEEALKLGAMALFGEKYGEVVRVVTIDPQFSIELCGGTHVGNTGELGYFKILSETAVAAGVRRIEAVSGLAAENFVNEQFAEIRILRDLFKNPKDIRKSIENLQLENDELKKHIEHLEARQLVTLRNELLQKDEIINQVNFIGSLVELPHPEALKKLCFDLRNHLRDYVVVLCANIDGKPFVALTIADNVAAAMNLDAGRIIKEQVAPLIKGGGGGQKTLATAGGQDASRLHEVIEKVRSLL
jgi:alanyl-tRNA synthetase